MRKRKSERRRRKARCLLGKVLFLCCFIPTSGSVNIPLFDLERDIDISDVGEVRGQHRKTAIAPDDEVFCSDYERSDASI